MITSSTSILARAKFLPKTLALKKLAGAQVGFGRSSGPHGDIPGNGMLIAIDANIEHGKTLAAGAIVGAQRLMLNADYCAIAQITHTIKRFPGNLKSLHIVTHSSPGCLHFSSGDITLANLHTYAEQIESWFSYQPLTKGSKVKVKEPYSSLSLYASNLATGDAGRDFLENLHYLTGVSVHASKGNVGSTASNGSWQLEVAYPFPRQTIFPFTNDLLETYQAAA